MRSLMTPHAILDPHYSAKRTASAHERTAQLAAHRGQVPVHVRALRNRHAASQTAGHQCEHLELPLGQPGGPVGRWRGERKLDASSSANARPVV